MKPAAARSASSSLSQWWRRSPSSPIWLWLRRIQPRRPRGRRLAAAGDQGANAEGQPPSATSFTRAELRKLLAPITLYPDPLLAQLLPASAYALQSVLAQRWLAKNPAAVENNDFSWIDRQNRDPAVKALARFPDHYQEHER